jgi:hypothetical protein
MADLLNVWSENGFSVPVLMCRLSTTLPMSLTGNARRVAPGSVKSAGAGP